MIPADSHFFITKPHSIRSSPKHCYYPMSHLTIIPNQTHASHSAADQRSLEQGHSQSRPNCSKTVATAPPREGEIQVEPHSIYSTHYMQPVLRWEKITEQRLRKRVNHSSLLFLIIVLSSSGIGGGTGSPEICFTALKRGGQASKQVPHFTHFSW